MNIEIFAASGGLAAGFRAAGIDFDLVFDHDADACDSYAANLGARPVQMDVHDLLRMVRCGWKMGGGLQLLVADPPCTPWSRAGKRKGLADERDMLAETVELIRLLRPRAYLIGNIPGLQDAPGWPTVQRLIGGLARDGYCVVDYACLDAADYGVPQRRLRPFWFGHLDGDCIRWPAPTHGDPRTVGHALPGMALRPWVTCREALQHLPIEEIGRPVRMKIRPNRNATAEHIKAGSDTTRCSSPDRPAATVVSHPSSKGGQIILTQGHRANRLDEPSQTMGAKVRNVEPQVLAADAPRPRTRDDRAQRTPQSARAAASDLPAPTLDTRQARAGSGNGVLAWPWDRPATTVTADPNGRTAPPGHRSYEGIGSLLSDPNAIVLSERAAMILQGFPAGWKLCGATKRARWSQLGQAVCPAVAEAIGRAIVEQRRSAADSAAKAVG